MADIEDPIIYLKQRSFSSLSLEEKLHLKNSQKRPELNISQKDGKTIRKFQTSWYDSFSWLTGSVTTNALYCFPCSLFGGEEPWAKSGVNVVKNFVQKANKHASSKKHISCNEFFCMLGKERIDHALVEAQKKSAQQHNKIVKKNRHIVGRLVDVVCFLARQELVFRGLYETDSKNKGNYLELLELLAMDESTMKDHLESNSIFEGISSDIQNDLIESVKYVIQEIILVELKNSDFVSIQVDETTDVSCGAQFTLVVRYVYKNELVERFLGLYDVSGNKMAAGLSSKILEVLNSCQIGKNKLVSQTYDGASVMSGSEGGVQTIIKQSYPQAIFVHCYAHHLNLVLLHSSKRIQDVKLFICNLTAFKTFFARSSLRLEELRKAGFAIPSDSDTGWNFHSRSVFSIFKNYQTLKKIMNFIKSSENFDPESTNLAVGLSKILDNPKFVLMLCLFYKIFLFSDHLYTVLQSKILSNPAICFQEVEQTIKNICKLRSDETVSYCTNECKDLLMNRDITENTISNFKRVAFEVLDTIIVQLKERFSDIDGLSFIDLLNKKMYPEYLRKSPKHLYQKLNETYPSIFDLLKLENELSVIYSCDIKQNLGPIMLFNYICDNDLNDVFFETVKLLKLLFTVPVTSASSETSTLKRIKTHLRNSMRNEKLSALSTLSIQKDIVGNCIKYPHFKERVIDHFATSKIRRPELIFKTI